MRKIHFSKKASIAVGVLAMILFAFGYYYVMLPAFNIHSTGTWSFIMALVIVAGALVGFREYRQGYNPKESKTVKGFVAAVAILAVIYLVGAVLSSPIVNAMKYQALLDVQEGEFTSDVEETSFDKIPLLDKASAEILGNRKMGSMADMVSQFEVDDFYSQINYNDKPVRVSPLRYASLIKWITNRKGGIPAYIRIDMATQTTELVKMAEGMKFTDSEPLNRNIYRHLRFKHPTYIYGELSFEIDEDGTPYWIAPVIKYNIGLFGGRTVGRVVLCNAITGEMEDYAIEEVPEWVDRAYSAELLIELYDYHGTLKHGFFNSILGQRDCLSTTNGYNYLAIDDDVWVYTGVTSVASDQSNVGFVLMNSRTRETKYYKVEGAIEDSAMDSAEGQVQNLHYVATFPLLLNISNEPTYFLALKDDAGLVKKYAMVNVQKYQIVAIGDTVAECKNAYNKLLLTNGIQKEEEDTREVKEVTGNVTKIAQTVIEGNTYFYLMVDSSDDIYAVPFLDLMDVIRINEGDHVLISYKEGNETNLLTGIKIPEE